MEKPVEDLLLQAIKIQDYDAVTYAISKGANPNKTVGHGKTCLGEAANVGNISILNLLISSINSQNGSNNPPTFSTHRKRSMKGCKRKHAGQNEDHNAKCKSFNDRSCNNNQGYFEFTHEEGSSTDESRQINLTSTLTPVFALISPQAELEWDEEIGNVAPTTSEDETWTSMYKWYAAILETTGAAIASAYIVNNGVDHQDAFGRTALHYAAEQGHTEAVKLLIDTGCKVDIAASDGVTPLHIAVIKNNFDAAKLLITAGSNVNYKTHEKMTTLHFAAARGHLDLVKFLITNGAFLEARDSNERTGLYLAAGRGHFEVVQYLIKCGANVNGEEIHGYTPLCEAVWQKFPAIVELLLNCGARITHSHRLLHNAIIHRQEEIVKLLTNFGGGINLHNDNGDTPLLLAARLSQPNIAKILLSKGANVNACNSITNASVLHIAVEKIEDPDVFEEMLQCLLEYNVNLDAVCISRDTPLNRAVMLGNHHAATLLVRHGADVNACNLVCGLDNLSVASKNNLYLAKMILKAGHYQIIFVNCEPTDAASRWLHYVCKNPFRLSDICRIKIRSLPRNGPLYPFISSLPLPDCMKRFLMLENGVI